MGWKHHIDGKPVNIYWYAFLKHARDHGVKFHISSGHRTLREQWKLFRANMHLVGGRWVPRAGHALTAYPLPTAPHIRYNHACDVDVGTQDLIEYGRRHGVYLARTVSSEYWHLEAKGLRAFYRKVHK